MAAKTLRDSDDYDDEEEMDTRNKQFKDALWYLSCLYSMFLNVHFLPKTFEMPIFGRI